MARGGARPGAGRPAGKSANTDSRAGARAPREGNATNSHSARIAPTSSVSAACSASLMVHERAPGGVSGCRDGTRARRVGGWLSCVAAPTGVCSCRRRCGAAEADPDDPCWITRHLWRAAGACRAPGKRGEAHERKRIARLMRTAGLIGASRRRGDASGSVG